MYKRILAPVDGSRASARGLKEAVGLARAHRARLKLLHVVDESVLTMNPEAAGIGGNLVDTLIAAGKRTIRNAQALAGRHGVKAETSLHENLAGRIADVILGEARKWRADLIVMGTHGRRGLSHVLLGSTAEAVVRAARVPVLLVRGSATTGRKRAAKSK